MARKVTAGTQFGKWTVTSEVKLGSGGNGAVWPATDNLGTNGAIKLLHRHHLEQRDDPTAVRRVTRFYDEVHFLLTYQESPGILPLLDAYTPERPTPDNRPWLVTPLAEPFSRIHEWDLELLIERLASVASTLADLHERSVFHRDIKPSNLFLLDNRALVGDFGLVDMPDKAAVTDKSEILGPLFYIAPEMMSNVSDMNVGPADVYSLAKNVVGSGHGAALSSSRRAAR